MKNIPIHLQGSAGSTTKIITLAQLQHWMNQIAAQTGHVGKLKDRKIFESIMELTEQGKKPIMEETLMNLVTAAITANVAPPERT